jgi:16S rRNA (adenine1518-N6/adenine1519-N6)-dimethyltransferase
VKAAWYADVRRAGSIGRTVFWPAPHVDSGWSPSPAASRRPATGWPPSPSWTPPSRSAARRCAPPRRLGRLAAAAEQRLRAAGIDPGARGEVLGVEDFARLAATPVA